MFTTLSRVTFQPLPIWINQGQRGEHEPVSYTHLVECPDRLLRTAVKIGLVDLVVAVFIVDIQVGVAVHRHQLYLARILVYVADDIYIRVGSLSDDRTAVVHAEDGDGPVALHLLLLLLCQFQVHNLLLVEGKPLDQIHAAL